MRPRPQTFACADLKCDEFNLSMCRSMVAMRDLDHTGTLGLQEFQSLWDDLMKWKVTSKIVKLREIHPEKNSPMCTP